MPEYRKIRTQAKSFLTLCYTPDLAAEVTLQPLTRFDMSAAIIFSDILVVPHAMGVPLEFVEGEGPRLAPVADAVSVKALHTEVRGHLEPVAEALRQVRARLAPEKSLIGFCGAPWTVACYMVEGKNKGGWSEARKFALQHAELFQTIIDRLVSASCDYLSLQIEAGADVIQIFDSWAGVLPESEYRTWVIAPTREIVAYLHAQHPMVPVIGFPRGSGALYPDYVRETGVDAVSIDVETPLQWAAGAMEKTLQGNLDPLMLAYDRQRAVEETLRIVSTMRGKKFIFNLGHGIVPQTPVENVAAVCEAIRNGA